MIKVANAPCSWGILEFDLEGEAAGFAQVLDEMQETGFAGTELGDWGFMPTEPRALEAELRARNLEMLGAFVPVNLSDPQAHGPGEETALKTARLLAAVAGEKPFIVLADDNGTDPQRTKNAGRIRPEDGLSEDQWAVFAQGAQRIAGSVGERTGLRTVFHHHCGGFVETPAEVDRLLELTDPDLLGLCFDSGHYAFGGGDPASGLRRHADRIWHVHFKDHDAELHARSKQEGWDYFRSVREGIFCELGKGDVDFPAIVGELKKMDYQGWIVVEQDVHPGMGSPKESAQRNRDYLRTIGL
ncbi:MAG TPA: sugar phosphate isomerase/epimerase [Anaerolineales bacterium]|nr:sugar phosphate isomerase/epimerase [Anaerolineales bacterium]